MATRKKSKRTAKRGTVATKPARSKKARPRKATRRPSAGRRAPSDTLHSRVVTPELSERSPHDETWEVFRRYDRDGSGFIDRSELGRLCEALGMALGEDELAVAFDAVDANRSGKISWEEFSAWWRSQ